MSTLDIESNVFHCVQTSEAATNWPKYQDIMAVFMRSAFWKKQHN